MLKVTWSQLCLKFALNNYKPHWQQHFERRLTVEDFTFADDYETNTDEGVCKIITCKKKPSLHFKEHFSNMEDGIALIFISFFLCPRNLIFKFDLELIE